jgi:hypothetical protein
MHHAARSWSGCRSPQQSCAARQVLLPWHPHREGSPAPDDQGPAVRTPKGDRPVLGRHLGVPAHVEAIGPWPAPRSVARGTAGPPPSLRGRRCVRKRPARRLVVPHRSVVPHCSVPGPCEVVATAPSCSWSSRPRADGFLGKRDIAEDADQRCHRLAVHLTEHMLNAGPPALGSDGRGHAWTRPVARNGRTSIAWLAASATFPAHASAASRSSASMM